MWDSFGKWSENLQTKFRSKYKLGKKEKTLALPESVIGRVVHQGKGSIWRAQVSQDAEH